MNDPSSVAAAESRFFTALVEADIAALDRLLSDDFILVDVMRGGEITRSTLLGAIGSGQLRFDTIERGDARERRYSVAAVVVGRTRMRGRFGDTPFEAESRYTHVYANEGGAWRLVSAQGTRIVDDEV